MGQVPQPDREETAMMRRFVMGGLLTALLLVPSAEVLAAPGEQVVAQAPLKSTGKYRVSGDALLVRRDDGSMLVRLANLDMDDGPALRVHLVPGREKTAPGGGTDLGPIKGTRGTHDYPVPTGAPVDLKGGTTVLVYCHRFNVAFGNATLASG
jgi:Electron transfer DM13